MRNYEMTEQTKARNREIRRLYESGSCIYDIAATYEMQPSTVEGILCEQGVSLDHKRVAKRVNRVPKVYPVTIEGKQYQDVTELFLMY